MRAIIENLMRLRERLRRQLLSETGLDFGRLRPSIGSVMSADGDAGGRLVRDLLAAMTAGLGTAIVLVAISAVMGLSGAAAFFAIFGGVVVGLGIAMVVAGVLLRRRIPEEVEAVFRVAGQVANDASSQLQTLSGSAEQIVRGLVMVSAVPAVATALSRRFLVLAPVVRALLDGMLTRIVDRGLPAVIATMPDATPRMGQIVSGVATSRDRVVGRATTLARWGTMPLRVLGVALAIMGTGLTMLSWLLGLA